MGVRFVQKQCTRCGGQATITCSTCGGGGTFTTTSDLQRSCPQCGGSNPTCTVCFGSGTVLDCVTRTDPCTACGGAGTSQCSACSGNGTITEPVYEPDPPLVELSRPGYDLPTVDEQPHLSAATSEQARPDPFADAIFAAQKAQLDVYGSLDAPIRQQEYEEHVADCLENGLQPQEWKEWDLEQRLHEGGHAHTHEEAEPIEF